MMLRVVTWLLITCKQSKSIDDALEPVQTWWKSSARLPIPSRNFRALYDNNFSPDLVWLVGSYHCAACVYYYNITNDSLSYYDTLIYSSSEISPHTIPSGVMINEMAYYLTKNGALFEYNISNKSETQIYDYSISQPCMTKNNRNNRELYIIGISSTVFNIFNLTDMTNYVGNSLLSSRGIPSCVVNEYLDDPYLYIIAGNNINIERIKLNENILTNEWELLPFQLSINNVKTELSELGFSSPISYTNFILLLGGYDRSVNNGSREIFYIDINESDAGLVGYLAQRMWSSGAVMANVGSNGLNKRIFTFGGSDGSGTLIDAIYYTDLLLPTKAPSSIPSHIPSTIPSSEPTNEPSTIPTTIPTNDPTSHPTSAPTSTNEPTTIPTMIPTVESFPNPTVLPRYDVNAVVYFVNPCTYGIL